MTRQGLRDETSACQRRRDPMKVVVVSCSFTGLCKQLAQTVCAQTGWESGEIIPKQPGTGFWRSAVEALRRRSWPAYQGPALHDFELVVLVAPIQGDRLAAPVRAFVSRHRAQLRQVALLTVMGRPGTTEADEEIRWQLGRAPVLSATILAQELRSTAGAAKLEGFERAVAALT